MFLRTVKKTIRDGVYRSLLYYHRKEYCFFEGDFNFESFREEVLSFLQKMRGHELYEFRFSSSQPSPDLYSSVYAAMLLGLMGELEKFSLKERNKWANYLLSFQGEDGLFRDSRIESPLAESCHYWGWHHLAPHVIVALDYLGVHPENDFLAITKLFDNISMDHWLKTREWENNYLAVSNEVMNVGILLQYSRDYFCNGRAESLLNEMKSWLLKNKRDPETSLWGGNTNRTACDVSKAVKAAYHIVPIYYYDNEEQNLNNDSVLYYALATQNRFGGFSPSLVADACEDIDSVYLLSIWPESSGYDVARSLEKYLRWVFVNQNKDGGFVFKRFRPFQYADQERLSSRANESNMFATWFRTLSIAFACEALKTPHQFSFSRVPGYQFRKRA